MYISYLSGYGYNKGIAHLLAHSFTLYSPPSPQMNANTLDVYRMSPDKSILDNVLRSKVLRRPVYATCTTNSITQVWRIEAHGALVRIAVINWSARSVAVGEVEQRLEDAMVKPKGLFQSGSVHGNSPGS